jgi:predicted transcriptional regulator
MSTTTSLKLPDELKQRAVAAAQNQGVSPHAFMVHAIEQAATAAEQRAGFVAEAQAAREQMLKTGKGYDADEVHAYLKARIAGRKSAKPKAGSWRG